jgi:phage terminase large subunit-like protein
LIEDNANGSVVIQMLGRELPGLLPVNPEGGKVARAAALSPLIEAGTSTCPIRTSRPG